MDANVTQGRSAFRYAPSVDVFYITPSLGLLEDINDAAREADPTFEAERTDFFAVGHRFIGHGNRDWRTNFEEYDFSASVEGRLAEDLGYDARISAYWLDGSVSGDTFVDAGRIRDLILRGWYDLANPESEDPNHQAAIRESSLTEEEDFGGRYLEARLALEGTGPGIGGRDTAWTAGVELADVEAHRLLEFRGVSDGRILDVNDVLGSGGTSYAGERAAAGAFAEVLLPLGDAVELRAAARADEYDDVGGLRAGRLGAVYRPSDIVALRASWSTGDQAPSMHHLHSTAAQDHPYVRCVPDIDEPPPRECDTANYRQVTRETTGNPDLEPSGSHRRSIGAEARSGPFYLVADWYWLETSDLPGQLDATWAMLNLPECPPGGGSDCIERRAGDITIHDSYANIADTEVSGANTRFGARAETGWGFVAMRGFWRYVATERAVRASAQRRAHRELGRARRPHRLLGVQLPRRDREPAGRRTVQVLDRPRPDARLERAVRARGHAVDLGRVQPHRCEALHEHREPLRDRRAARGRLGTHLLRNPQHAVLRCFAPARTGGADPVVARSVRDVRGPVVHRHPARQTYLAIQLHSVNPPSRPSR